MSILNIQSLKARGWVNFFSIKFAARCHKKASDP